MRPSFFALFAFLFVAMLQGAVPEGGTSCLPSKPLSIFEKGVKSEYGTGKLVSVADQSFSEAVQVTTSKKPSQSYHFQLSIRGTEPIKKEDVLFLSFAARTLFSNDETGEAQIGAIIEQNSNPHTKSLETEVGIGREWKYYQFPCRVAGDLDAGRWHLSLRLGYQIQCVEIADISLKSFGKIIDIKALPSSNSGYPGREPNAAWRRPAAERIEKLRKGNVKISVLDADGRPLVGASVDLTMKRHAFGFGSAVTAKLLTEQSPDAEKYREHVTRCFSRVVFENDLKWPVWQNVQSREKVIQALDWLASHQIEVRGHCLVWPGWQRMPRHIKDLAGNPEKLRRTINDHVRDEATALAGRLIDWDVINEPFTNHDVMDILGNDVMVEWFKTARSCDPKVRLFLNDYSILTGGGRDHAHQAHFEKTIRYLVDHGAPIDGIGMQAHFGQSMTAPVKMLEILDRFAVFQLPITATEHDINTFDETVQADFTRDFLTTLFSHPSVDGILTWGFWEKSHWRPPAAYFRQDWSITPAGKEWIRLVTQEWWTKEKLTTDASGTAGTRGFLGDYEVNVTAQGKTAATSFKLPKDGTEISVRLK